MLVIFILVLFATLKTRDYHGYQPQRKTFFGKQLGK